MARKNFESIMEMLKDEVLILGSMVEQATRTSVDALLRGDTATARDVIKQDHRINEKRYAIENAVLVQMATQQPMAHDLRFLAAILEIIVELERMGDYAKGIGKITLLLEDATIPLPVTDFNKLTQLSLVMLHRGLTAFVNDDLFLAEQVPNEDDAIDACYNLIYHKVIASIIVHPDWVDQGNYLMWAAHNLERLADRVVNICERTVFTCTGETLEFDMEEEEVG